MTREIKFRAWTGERMVENVSITNTYNGYVAVSFGDAGSMRSPEPYYNLHPDWILMQFTGLKDKNGTEIYEGDIIKHTCDSPGPWDAPIKDMITEVVFNKGCASFWLENSIWEHELSVKDEHEVLGNIYENKGLLRN